MKKATLYSDRAYFSSHTLAKSFETLNSTIQGCEPGQVFDGFSCISVTCTNYIAGNFTIDESNFDPIQSALSTFVERFVSDETELGQYKRAIWYFNTKRWNGRLESLVEHFNGCFDKSMDLFLRPDFDVVIVRVYIFWKVQYWRYSTCALVGDFADQVWVQLFSSV